MHARSVVAAAIDERTGELVQRRMGSSTEEIVALAKRCADTLVGVALFDSASLEANLNLE